MGIRDLHGNDVFVGFLKNLTLRGRNDSAESANGLRPLAFEKSYVTLVAPKNT